MDVNEVTALAEWLDDHVRPAMKVYDELAVAMEQNSNSGTKVPLREYLNAVEQSLRAMPVEQLTYQQTDVLAHIEIFHLLGEEGWRFVERTVKEGNYDPASAASDIRAANQRIVIAVQSFSEARSALSAVGMDGESKYDSSDKVTVRIRFKDEVKIANISQLKNRAADWYDISRGLAIAAGERPEDVEVKGATTGSVIFILGTTLTVATIISLIMKQVAATVKSTMDVAHTLQDWKTRKIADDVVEKVLQDRQKSIEDNGTAEALKLVKEKIGAHIKGDVENALKKSIEKMFSFAAKGGEVDMLPPPQPSEDEDINEAVADAINTITKNVEEMRILKATTQLLIENKANKIDEGDERPEAVEP